MATCQNVQTKHYVAYSRSQKPLSPLSTNSTYIPDPCRLSLPCAQLVAAMHFLCSVEVLSSTNSHLLLVIFPGPTRLLLPPIPPYVAAMSTLSLPLRPLEVRGKPSTLSLGGMEIAAAKKSPLSAEFRKSEIQAKPLPPTPTFRVASSVYSVYVEGAPRTPKFNKSGNTLPSKVFLHPHQGLKQRASTSNLPDGPPSPPRPRLTQSKTHPAVVRLAERKKIRSSFYGEWKAPKWEDDSDNEDDPETPGIGKAFSHNDLRPGTPNQSAEEHAADYASVLAARMSAIPASLIPGIIAESSHIEYDESQDPLTPGPLTATLTDPTEDGTIPPSERFSSISEEYMPRSRWSSASSSPTSPIQFPKKTFKLRAQKAFLAQKTFHSRKPAPEKAEKKGHRRDESNSSWTSHSTGDSNGSSMNSADRAAIEKGVLNIYDTLDSPYDLITHKPRTEVTKPKNVLWKGEPSPKSWEAAKTPSPRSRSDRTSWSTQASDEGRASISSEYREMVMKHSFPRRASVKERSVGMKLVTAVGLNRGRNKKKASEKKRQEMKKKIVVVRRGGSVDKGP